ncbi:MAG: Serine-tRNA ligase, partial [Candidatus Jorgensenbacteria bacterium GW2011_GWF2_41_8]
GLRAFLRQDPDIIMVGEIRDAETAEIAIHAAMTGHIVLSTLHTNDAPTTIPRLLDMGIPSFLIAFTANISVAQRLVRKICPDCKQEFKLTAENIKDLENIMDAKKMLDFSEQLLQELDLPYQMVETSTGDMGPGKRRMVDLETWMPSQERYRETHSSSYFHDFQSRRLNIKYRDRNNEVHFVHSLNNTALATPRILANIIENYQTKKGTVVIPKVLKKYMQGIREIKKK